jgi:phage virion morphogenesis protein
MIKLEGDKEIQNKLNEMMKKLEPSQFQRALDTVGEMIQGSIEESFQDKKSPFGESWAPLKMKTLISKKKKGYRSSILRNEGDLEDKWTHKASGSSVAVGTNVKSKKGFAYASVHHFGSEKKNIKARSFLPVDKSGTIEKGLKEDILDALEDHIFND